MQITVRTAAHALGVDEDLVYRWIKQGELPAIRVGEDWRVDRAELLEWATGRGMTLSPELFEGAGKKDEFPSLLEALLIGGIKRGVQGEDGPSALRAMVDRLGLPDDVDREYLYEVMLAREDLGSTGIGEGIAIPHVRDPLVLSVPRPTVTLCFLERGVDFKAIDGLPVDILFAIICPTVRDHLHLLSRLGFVLRDKAFKKALKARASTEVILARLAEAEAKINSPDQKND